MKDLRRVAATSFRQLTSRGQARHTDCLAASSPGRARWRRARTSAALPATGVAALAGSSGHPVPGATGRPGVTGTPTTRCRRGCHAR